MLFILSGPLVIYYLIQIIIITVYNIRVRACPPTLPDIDDNYSEFSDDVRSEVDDNADATPSVIVDTAKSITDTIVDMESIVCIISFPFFN